MTVSPTLVDGDVVAEVQCGENTTVLFKAENVRRTRTGDHARVKLGLRNHGNVSLLGFNNFNVERNADRVSLSNQAWQRMPEAFVNAELYTKGQFKADLDDFCLAIWDTHTAQFGGDMAHGDPEYTTEWYCPPLVMKGGGTILVAKGGSGKSFTAQTAAVTINSGSSRVWYPVMCAPTGYINLERSEASMRGRLARINAAMGLLPNEPLYMLEARGKSIDTIYQAAKADIERYELEVIVLDSISAAGRGDLNENAPANALMDMLNALSATWLAVAHSPGHDRNKVFGSEMYANRADLVVRLTSQQIQDKLGVGLSIIKANDAKIGQDHYIKYQFNGTGLERIAKADLEEFPELGASKPMSRFEQVKTFIQDQGGSATPKEISDGLEMGRTNVMRILATDAFTKIPREGREQPYALKSNDEER
jgi:archaellum biogenesis ATPase FlaH